MPLSRMQMESYTNLPESSIKQTEDSEWSRGAITSKTLEQGEEAVTSRRFQNKSGFLLRVTVCKAGEQSLKVWLLLSLSEDWGTSDYTSLGKHRLAGVCISLCVKHRGWLEIYSLQISLCIKIIWHDCKKKKVIFEILSTGDSALCCQYEVQVYQSISRLKSPLHGTWWHHWKKIGLHLVKGPVRVGCRILEMA